MIPKCKSLISFGKSAKSAKDLTSKFTKRFIPLHMVIFRHLNFHCFRKVSCKRMVLSYGLDTF